MTEKDEDNNTVYYTIRKYGDTFGKPMDIVTVNSYYHEETTDRDIEIEYIMVGDYYNYWGKFWEDYPEGMAGLAQRLCRPRNAHDLLPHLVTRAGLRALAEARRPSAYRRP